MGNGAQTEPKSLIHTCAANHNFVGRGGFPAFTTSISLNMVIQAPAQKLTIVGIIDEFLKFTLDNYYTNFVYANDRAAQVQQEELVIEKMDFVFLATGIDQQE